MVVHPQLEGYSPEDAAAWLCGELGLSVFPLEPRGKRPPAGFSWQSCQTERLPTSRVCELAERHPGANWAVALGPVSDAVVVDADDDAARQWVMAHYLPTPWVTKTGKGWHLWYRYPHDGEVANQNLRTQGVNAEIKSAGTYVVAPRSIHPTGAVYELWTDEGASWDDVPEFAPLPSRDNIDLSAAASLESVEASFCSIVKGDRNNALARYAGRLVAAGLPFEEVKARVLRKNDDLCEPPLPRREAVGVACSVFRTHQRNHPEGSAPADGVQKPDDRALLYDMEGVAVCNESAEDAPWPEEVLHPGGLLEEIMNFTAASSVRTHPVYSLAGAITVVASLAGQRVKTDTNLTTNVYCAALGKSASGKDAPKRAVSRLIGRVAREALGGSDVASDTAIITRLQGGCRRQCYTLDELGLFLKACKSPASSRAGVAKLLTELFSCYDSPYVKTYADESNNKVIEWQNLCILGLSVPEEFWGAMQDGESVNGFIARFLIFDHAGAPEPLNESMVPDIPPALEEALKGVWAIDGGEHKERVTPTGAADLGKHVEPQLIPFEPEARKIHWEGVRWADAESVKAGEDKAGAAAASVWGRCAEHAAKLALVHAVSRLGRDIVAGGRIELEDVKWAWLTARTSCSRLTAKMQSALHSSDFEAWCNMAEDAVRKYVKREAGKGRAREGAPLSAIEKTLPIPPKLTQEVISKMVRSNRLRAVRHLASARSRRPLELYCIVRETEDEANGSANGS